MTEEQKYYELRNKLKLAPRIKTKDDFNARLFQKLDEAKRQSSVQVAAKESAGSRIADWITSLFKPGWVPALGLTVIVLIFCTVYFLILPKKNADNFSMKFNETPASERTEFVIYKHIEQDNSTIVSTDTEMPLSESTDRTPERFSSDVETIIRTERRDDDRDVMTPPVNDGIMDQRLSMPSKSTERSKDDSDKGAMPPKSTDRLKDEMRKDDIKTEGKVESKKDTMKKGEEKKGDDKSNNVMKKAPDNSFKEDKEANQEIKIEKQKESEKTNESKSEDKKNDSSKTAKSPIKSTTDDSTTIKTKQK